MGNSRANACGRHAPTPVVRLGPGPGRNRGQADPTRASETVNRRPAVSFPAMHDFDNTWQPAIRGNDLRALPLESGHESVAARPWLNFLDGRRRCIRARSVSFAALVKPNVEVCGTAAGMLDTQ